MKTIKQGVFKRLLKKIDTSFDDRVVKAEFDNGLICLEANINYSTNECSIVLWDDAKEIFLSEEQKETIFKLMDGCYNNNISQWDEDNKEQLKEDFKCDRADEERKDM